MVINADDFGLTVNVSRAIIEGYQKNALTSTSAMTCVASFKDSAQMALENGITSMGIHTTLTVLKPSLPLEEVPSLVNEQGNFFSAKEFFLKEIDVNEARKEIENQIHLLLDSGLKLDHIDSHHGLMQKNEDFTRMYLDLAEKYQVPLRNEFSHFAGNNQKLIFDQLQKRGIHVTDNLYGNHDLPDKAYDLLHDFLKEAVNQYETIEYFCHPGYSDDYLRSISTLNDLREIEFAFMCSEKVLNLYQEMNIELIPYAAI